MWIRVAASMLVVLAASGCGRGDSVGDLQRALVESYLDPIDDAGMTSSVARSCRLADSTADRWHLSVEVQVDGPQDRVADVLEDHDVVLRRDHDPMIVQQIFNEPGEGWDGILARAGEKSTLSLSRWRVIPSDRADAVGWEDACPA